MTTKKPDPLHGVTLKDIVTTLHDHYGWQHLGNKISIKCFTKNPSIQSSLKFLRRTPWAREKVERLYLYTIKKKGPWKTKPGNNKD